MIRSLSSLDSQNQPSDPVANPISELFVDLEREHGNDEVTKQATRALASTLRDLVLNPDSSLHGMLDDFLGLISTAHPQPTAFVRVLQRVCASTKGITDQLAVRKAALGMVEQQAQLQAQVLGLIAKNAAPLFKEPRVVFIRSFSRTLLAVLEGAAQYAQQPQVILASQEKPKARKLISFLSDRSFNHIVIDEHALSHVISKIDFGLFGALALTGDGQLLLAPGVMALMAALRQAGKNCYVALSLDKIQFASENQAQVYVRDKRQTYGDLVVTKRYFSHDIAALELATGIITESGILTPEEILKFQLREPQPN